MRRLDWKIDPDGSLNAWSNSWRYEIIPHDDGASEERGDLWQLTCSREDVEDSKWFLARYLEDAMALATAIDAGVEID